MVIGLKGDAWSLGDYTAYLTRWDMHPVRRYVIQTLPPQVLESRFYQEWDADKKKLKVDEAGNPVMKSDPKFATLGTWTLKNKGTSCGMLPGWVMLRLGARAGFGSSDVQGLRDHAEQVTPNESARRSYEDYGFRTKGVWVYADPKNPDIRPLPGDLYGVTTAADPSGVPQHVGVIVDPRPNRSGNWITADSGQGGRPEQKALYVERYYDPQAGTLSGPMNTRPGNATPTETGTRRVITGWVSLELLRYSSGLFADDPFFYRT